MPANLQSREYENRAVLYMAMELSNEKWRLAFGDGARTCQVCIDAGDMAALIEQVDKTKAKWGLEQEAGVVSCYEAGRDGFWLHRQLEDLGISNQVVDAASIEVSRRARRAKADRLDAQGLLEKLIRYEGGERRVPSADWEDLRQLHREREQLRGLIADSDPLKGVRSLMLLSGIGWVGAWTLVLEVPGWRHIANRRQLASLAGWCRPLTTAAPWCAIRGSARQATPGCAP